MTNPLIKYFEERFQASDDAVDDSGPVVTISREFGCQAGLIAQMLADKLNEYYLPIGAKKKWRLISKEILDQSARELKTESTRLEYVFNYEQKKIIDEFLVSLSAKHYLSDWKIRDTIKKVIRGFAIDGYTIIIGRAAAQISRDIPKSLHIRLMAPLDWRISNYAARKNISLKEAGKKVKEIDENRQKLIQTFATEGHCMQCYDVYYSTTFLTPEQIVSDIIHLMQLKKLI